MKKLTDELLALRARNEEAGARHWNGVYPKSYWTSVTPCAPTWRSWRRRF